MAPIKLITAVLAGLSTLAVGAPTATNAKLLGKRASINDVSIVSLVTRRGGRIRDIDTNFSQPTRPPLAMQARMEAPQVVPVVQPPRSPPTLPLLQQSRAIPPKLLLLAALSRRLPIRSVLEATPVSLARTTMPF
jgi:hypothetical protein